MSEWKNITSYSKSSDRSEVRTVELKLNGLSIIVTKHIHYGDELVMTCRELGIDTKGLGVSSMDEAKRLAIVAAYTKVENMLDQLKEFV